jgi:aspartate/methionine/tyrosine aminotransferase
VPPAHGPAHNLFSREDWESTLISLYSFSKSYAVPGHRVGAIIASSELLEDQISKVLDTMIICPPRAAQKTLQWAIGDPDQKAWRQERADELAKKRKLFSEVINAVNARLADTPSLPASDSPSHWEIEGIGAYYAFLKHPYETLSMDSLEIGEIFARKLGVICLPGNSFGQENSQHLRVSISNVGEDDIRLLEDRLVALDGVIRDL